MTYDEETDEKRISEIKNHISKNGFSNTRTVINTKQPINNIKIIKDSRINIINNDIKFNFDFIRSKLTFLNDNIIHVL